MVWRINDQEEFWDNGTWVVAIWLTNEQKSITESIDKTSNVPFEREKQESNLEVVGDAVGFLPTSPYGASALTFASAAPCSGKLPSAKWPNLASPGKVFYPASSLPAAYGQ